MIFLAITYYLKSSQGSYQNLEIGEKVFAHALAGTSRAWELGSFGCDISGGDLRCHYYLLAPATRMKDLIYPLSSLSVCPQTKLHGEAEDAT